MPEQDELRDLPSEAVNHQDDEPGGRDYEQGSDPRYEDGSKQEIGRHVNEDGEEVSTALPRTQDEADAR